MTGSVGGTTLPTCSNSFTISKLTVGPPRGAMPPLLLTAAGIAAVVLAGLAYYCWSNSRADAAALEDAEDLERLRGPRGEDGLHPIIKPRAKRTAGANAGRSAGAAAGKGRRSAPMPRAAEGDDDEEEEELPPRPSARAKGSARVHAGAPAKPTGRKQGAASKGGQGRR